MCVCVVPQDRVDSVFFEYLARGDVPDSESDSEDDTDDGLAFNWVPVCVFPC